MYCNQCGALIADGSSFCTNCGARVAPEAPAYEEPAVEKAATEEPAAVEPAAEPVTEQAAPEETVSTPPVEEEPAAQEQQFKFCTQCGARVSADADFCIVCGNSFNPAPQSQGAYNAPPQGAPQYGAPNRNPYSYRAEDHGGVGAGNAYQYSQPSNSAAQTSDLIKLLIKAFMVVGCVTFGWLIIPLLWCIPMTIKAFHCIDRGEPMTLGFKICSLLFVNLIAGVCMLCINDEGNAVL
jgi:RNA polymerase subunit RPABC4/transcription elongation factor Spt4